MSNINSSKFQEMVQAAASRLNEQAEYVNSLNVFPVPDGDTGTNMGMTITNGAKDVASKPAETVGEVAQILSKGLLMGARGNSGVILSQLFRGFAQYVKDYEEIDGIHLAAALQNGVEVAYKAVMKPVEGTILTVSRGAAELAKRKTDETDDAVEIMEAALEGAKKALAMTPDMLPVLKEVGVVDSGGQGLVYIYEGFLMALNGEFVPETPVAELGAMDRMVNVEHESVANVSTADIKYGYCTEIMVELGKGPTSRESYDHDNFQTYLAGIGNSLLVVDDEEVVKVHVHTEDPGLVMQEGLKYGRLVKVKVDNMRIQNEGVAEKEAKSSNVSTSTSKKDWGLIAIAAEVAEIPVEVIESATVPQGFTALLSFDPTRSIEENKAAMTSALSDVQSGSVTTAIRDTNVDGIEIHKKDTLGMLNNKIVVSTRKMNDAIFAVFDQMIDEDSEIVAIYIGEEGKKANAEKIAKELEKKYPEIEVEIHDGKQPVYPYLFSVE